jgi:hydrogenase maturation protease
MQGRSHVVLLDAMLDAAEPGALELWEEDDLGALEDRHGHAHHLPLIEAVRLLRSASLPSSATRLTLITVGIESAFFGHGLSPELGARLPGILSGVRAIIEKLSGQDGQKCVGGQARDSTTGR